MSEKTLSERIEEDGITVNAEMIDQTPHGHYAYRVTLTRPDGRVMQLHDYSGPWEPTALDALGVLLSVASRVEGAESYEDWASEFELDPEKWQDRKTYELQCAETDKLRAFLDADTLRAYLYETEMDD